MAAPVPRPNNRDQQLPATVAPNITPAAPTTQNAAPAAVKEDPTLAASLFLHLDREVLVVGETALLTTTVRSKFFQEVAGLTFTLMLPPGLQTAEGATGALTWPVPATPANPLFVQTTQLRVDSANLSAAAAVLMLAANLSAPGYTSVAWSTTLGVAPTPGGSEPVVEATQGSAGAVLQVDNGLLTLLAEPDAVDTGTTFVYTELYRWDHTPITPTATLAAGAETTTTVILSDNAATTPLTPTTPLTLTAPLTMTTPATVTTPVTPTRAPLTTPAASLLYLPLIQEVGQDTAGGVATSPVAESSGLQSPVSNPQSPTDAKPAKKPKPKGDANVDMYFIWQLDAKEGNQEVKAFKKSVQVAIDLKWLLAAGLEPAMLTLWTRKKAKARWEPVRTEYDAKRQVLMAQLPHFSQFGLGAGLSQHGEILPSVIGFTTDRLTGGVSLHYPIETPAGLGGLQPNLSFSYSSLAADDLFLDSDRQFLSQTSGVGHGWSVAGSANMIVRTGGDLDNNTPDTWKSFSVMLNGIRASIRYEEGAWRTDPETFYKVFWDGSDQTGQYAVTDWGGWTLIAPDGTTYQFGDANAFAGYSLTSPTAVFLETTGGGNTYRLAKQWYLRQVTDVLGNKIDYFYKTEQQAVDADDCLHEGWSANDNWYTSAVYPERIEWSDNNYAPAGAKLRVSFAYLATDREDYDIEDWDWDDCQQVKFAKRDQLQSVAVQALIGANWSTLRSYALTQVYGAYNAYDGNGNFDRQVKRLRLSALAMLGANNGVLQTYSFGYQAQADANPNQIHLVSADNGWGGAITYTLHGHRTECPQDLCGQYSWRSTRFAVKRTQVSDGLGNYRFVDYNYGPYDSQDGEWGRIGQEEGGGQFFGFRRSEATYYDVTQSVPATLETAPAAALLKWDAQDSFPGAQDNPDPRAGKPITMEVRTAPTTTLGSQLLSLTTYKWKAYRRVNGQWQETTKNRETNNNVTTYPIIWVRQEQEEQWSAGGSWTAGVYTNNDNGAGQLTRRFYDETPSFRGYGNVIRMEEYSHINPAITQADWRTAVNNNNLSLLRQTLTEFFPNDTPTTGYLVNLPARVRLTDLVNDCYGETRTTYVDMVAFEKNRYGDYRTPPRSRLPARQEQARNACSDAQPSAYGSEAPFYTTDWVNNWSVTFYDYDGLGNSLAVRNAGASPSQDVTLQTTYESVYRLFSVSQRLNNDPVYQETATYYGVNEISGYSGVAVWGAMQQHCGVNEVCTRQTYDEFGRRQRRWDGVAAGAAWGADGDAQTLWTYNMFGALGLNRSVITEWRAPRCYGNFVRKVYNGLGELLQEQKPQQDWSTDQQGCGLSVNYAEVDVNYAYDGLGRQTQTSVPVTTSANWVNRAAVWNNWTRSDYDGLGRAILSTAPNGEQTQTTLEGRKLWQVGIGRNGNPNKLLKATESDGLGHLLSVSTYNPSGDPNNPWTLDGEVLLTHDLMGNLLNVTHPQGIGITDMSYDLAGHKLSMNDPDLGAWSYAYDRQGRLVRQTDGRKQTTCLYYDGFERLAGKYFRDDAAQNPIPACPTNPTYNIAYGYDAGHNPATGSRSRGQLTSVSKTGYSKTLGYNNQGLLGGETVTIGGAPQSYTTLYGYDAYLRPTTTTYPDNEIVTVNYNGMGLPNRLNSSLASTALVDGTTAGGGVSNGAAYDEAGRLTAMHFALGGGLWRTQAYWPWSDGTQSNSNGRLKEIKVGQTNGSSNRLYYLYGYDSFGNIGGMTEQFNSGASNTYKFCYDAQNRLTRGYATYIENQACENYTTGRSYAYDPAGRLNSYESAAMTPANGHPHAIMPTGAGLTLDANGNFQTLSNGRSLTWDQENRLSEIGFGLNQSESYLYDPDGQRVKKVGTTQTTYYVSPNYEVTVENSAPNPPVAITLESTIANGNDDAQERPAGYMSRAGTSLSMVFNIDQKVGYRFTNVTIPPGATITNAYVQFKAYKNDSNTDNLTLQGEAADNPVTFTDNDYDISSRPRTIASVAWSPGAWTTNNSYQTPNLTGIVQEIVNRPGWVSGNALVALVTAPGPNYGNRAAISYNYQPANAAKLHIEYIPATTTKYYSFNGQRVAMRKNGVLYYLHTDHLGGTALVTKSDGSVESEQGYWAYGRYRTGGTLPTDYKFTGQKLDATGLMYFNARYYDLELGIFISPDTLVPDPTNLLAHNRYMYVLGNPLKFLDPSGHDPLNAAWEQEFWETHCRAPTDQDRLDRLFSVMFRGSAANGSWTQDDWQTYLQDRDKYWSGESRWDPDPMEPGLERFATHVDRLAAWYTDDETHEFVRAFGWVFADIRPNENPGWPAIYAGLRASPLSKFLGGLTYLKEGNANWNPDVVDDAHPSHHYAGLFYAGYWYGSLPGKGINWARDSLFGSSPPDIGLGNGAAAHGWGLRVGHYSMADLANVIRITLGTQDQLLPPDPYR